MATDKRLDQVSTLTDFDYALIVKGDQVAKASKQQLAELVGNLLYGATNASSLATVVAGLIGLSSIIKILPSGASFSLGRGYGLLIVGNMSTGHTGVYSVQNGNPVALNTALSDIEISRVSEGEITIKNNNVNSRRLNISFVGLV